MMEFSFEDTKAYLRDCATEELRYLVPFVVTDPHNLIRMEDYMEYPFYEIDLAQTKAGDFEKHIHKILKQKKPVVLFKNVDQIRSRKDKVSWQNMVITAMKNENFTTVFGDHDLSLPFDKIKAIGTCSIFPDYLRKRGNLGIGPDFSKFK